MTEPKTIYCPRCGRKVAVWDGRSSMNISVNCKKCRKRVVYHVDTGTTELKKNSTKDNIEWNDVLLVRCFNV